jgi:hypothetical protein
MPKKYVVFFKSIGRKWFIILVFIILLIFLYNQIAAIWVTAITLILFILSYIPEFFFKNKLVRFMKRYYMIEEDTIAQELRRPLREIREKLFELSQNQENKKSLIVFLNKKYIFYHKTTIEKFNELFNEGFGDKEILENLQEYDLRTRAEVKIISETLMKLNRLGERKISVKDRRDKIKYA